MPSPSLQNHNYYNNHAPSESSSTAADATPAPHHHHNNSSSINIVKKLVDSSGAGCSRALSSASPSIPHHQATSNHIITKRQSITRTNMHWISKILNKERISYCIIELRKLSQIVKRLRQRALLQNQEPPLMTVRVLLEPCPKGCPQRVLLQTSKHPSNERSFVSLIDDWYLTDDGSLQSVALPVSDLNRFVRLQLEGTQDGSNTHRIAMISIVLETESYADDEMDQDDEDEPFFGNQTNEDEEEDQMLSQPPQEQEQSNHVEDEQKETNVLQTQSMDQQQTTTTTTAPATTDANNNGDKEQKNNDEKPHQQPTREAPQPPDLDESILDVQELNDDNDAQKSNLQDYLADTNNADSSNQDEMELIRAMNQTIDEETRHLKRENRKLEMQTNSARKAAEAISPASPAARNKSDSRVGTTESTSSQNSPRRAPVSQHSRSPSITSSHATSPRSKQEKQSTADGLYLDVAAVHRMNGSNSTSRSARIRNSSPLVSARSRRSDTASRLSARSSRYKTTSPTPTVAPQSARGKSLPPAERELLSRVLYLKKRGHMRVFRVLEQNKLTGAQLEKFCIQCISQGNLEAVLTDRAVELVYAPPPEDEDDQEFYGDGTPIGMSPASVMDGATMNGGGSSSSLGVKPSVSPKRSARSRSPNTRHRYYSDSPNRRYSVSPYKKRGTSASSLHASAAQHYHQQHATPNSKEQIHRAALQHILSNRKYREKEGQHLSNLHENSNDAPAPTDVMQVLNSSIRSARKKSRASSIATTARDRSSMGIAKESSQEKQFTQPEVFNVGENQNVSSSPASTDRSFRVTINKDSKTANKKPHHVIRPPPSSFSSVVVEESKPPKVFSVANGQVHTSPKAMAGARNGLGQFDRYKSSISNVAEHEAEDEMLPSDAEKHVLFERLKQKLKEQQELQRKLQSLKQTKSEDGGEVQDAMQRTSSGIEELTRRLMESRRTKAAEQTHKQHHTASGGSQRTGGVRENAPKVQSSPTTAGKRSRSPSQHRRKSSSGVPSSAGGGNRNTTSTPPKRAHSRTPSSSSRHVSPPSRRSQLYVPPPASDTASQYSSSTTKSRRKSPGKNSSFANSSLRSHLYSQSATPHDNADEESKSFALDDVSEISLDIEENPIDEHERMHFVNSGIRSNSFAFEQDAVSNASGSQVTSLAQPQIHVQPQTPEDAAMSPEKRTPSAKIQQESIPSKRSQQETDPSNKNKLPQESVPSKRPPSPKQQTPPSRKRSQSVKSVPDQDEVTNLSTVQSSNATPAVSEHKKHRKEEEEVVSTNATPTNHKEQHTKEAVPNKAHPKASNNGTPSLKELQTEATIEVSPHRRSPKEPETASPLPTPTPVTEPQNPWGENHVVPKTESPKPSSPKPAKKVTSVVRPHDDEDVSKTPSPTPQSKQQRQQGNAESTVETPSDPFIPEEIATATGSAHQSDTTPVSDAWRTPNSPAKEQYQASHQDHSPFVAQNIPPFPSFDHGAAVPRKSSPLTMSHSNSEKNQPHVYHDETVLSKNAENGSVSKDSTTQQDVEKNPSPKESEYDTELMHHLDSLSKEADTRPSAQTVMPPQGTPSTMPAQQSVTPSEMASPSPSPSPQPPRGQTPVSAFTSPDSLDTPIGALYNPYAAHQQYSQNSQFPQNTQAQNGPALTQNTVAPTQNASPVNGVQGPPPTQPAPTQPMVPPNMNYYSQDRVTRASQRDSKKIDAMIRGSNVLKYHFGKRSQKQASGAKRLLKLEKNLQNVSIAHTGFLKRSHKIPINDIHHIVYGPYTRTLKGRASTRTPWRCFSLVMEDRSIDLEATTDLDAELWVLGLQSLIYLNIMQNMRPLYSKTSLVMKRIQLKLQMQQQNNMVQFKDVVVQALLKTSEQQENAPDGGADDKVSVVSEISAHGNTSPRRGNDGDAAKQGTPQDGTTEFLEEDFEEATLTLSEGYSYGGAAQNVAGRGRLKIVAPPLPPEPEGPPPSMM